jgi:hypothetical protein
MEHKNYRKCIKNYTTYIKARRIELLENVSRMKTNVRVIPKMVLDSKLGRKRRLDRVKTRCIIVVENMFDYIASLET